MQFETLHYTGSPPGRGSPGGMGAGAPAIVVLSCLKKTRPPERERAKTPAPVQGGNRGEQRSNQRLRPVGRGLRREGASGLSPRAAMKPLSKYFVLEVEIFPIQYRIISIRQFFWVFCPKLAGLGACLWS
ncbi:hypothetical protein Hsero_0596 [Herbaspirillum seropedicae SmR1]|uniref:Uncharacterized protein n=1 Tax=Herbaspirillum seropedicae (strain SmR1) TaxID=757424 RepID=D8IYF5_HERSS|nr:hypothetical protein Hsero_0596 [Herbaspirillum seropedicae SmR1]